MTTKKPKGKGSAVTFEMPVHDLCAIFRQLKFCICPDEDRPALRGLFIEAVRAARRQPDCLRLIATDGHKLGHVERPMACDVWTDMPANGETRGVIVPSATVDRFLQWPKSEADCTVNISSAGFSIKCDGLAMKVRSKAIKEIFPNYRRVIPSKFRSVLTVDPGEFVCAVCEMADGADEGARLKLAFENDRIWVSMDSWNQTYPDEQRVKCTWQKGRERTEMWFNYHYVVGILDQFLGPPDNPARSVELHLLDPCSPVLFRTASQPDGFYLLMPCNPLAPTRPDTSETAGAVH